jgi:hypothetical protein
MMRFLTLLTTLLALFVAQQASTQPQYQVQPLVIVVRDGQGSPLAGVTLRLLVAGPPDEPLDSCVTDGAGQCRLLLPPGAYIIRFEGGWQGQSFISPAQQNGGALTDGGASGGGFGVYIQPGQVEQIITFVVGRKDGQLVPLWDMSRSPNAPPQPYAPPENPFDTASNPLTSIDLGSLAPGEVTLEGTAQVAESQIDAGSNSTPAPTRVPGSTVTPSPAATDGHVPAGSLWLGLVGLGVVVALAALGAVLINARRKERS